MNKLIFTQDIEGERKWLLDRFPEFDTVETEFSGLWPNDRPIDCGRDLLWEVPPDATVDNFDQCDCEKLLSLYSSDLGYVDPRWVYANGIVSDRNYGSAPPSNWAMVLTMQRCGTVLLEDILYNTLKYQRIEYSTPWSHHFLGESRVDQEVAKMLGETNADVFVCYRKDWWEWTLSRILGQVIRNETDLGKEPHSTDNIDWHTIPSRTVTEQDLEILLNRTTGCWNSICDLREKFPLLNFYVLEYQDIIQFEQLSQQRKINYDKSNLISNYHQAKDIFDKKFLPKFEMYQHNALSCLAEMNCDQNNILKKSLT
jgi:hypothetical protein